MTRKAAATPAVQQINYTRLSTELADITDRMENGELTVDEAVECYERGLKLISQLEAYLLRAENRVAELRAENHIDGDEKDKDETGEGNSRA